MKPVLPVIIEELIDKVKSDKLHPEQKQYYVTTLENIRNEADKAIQQYEKQRKTYRR